MAAPAPNTDPPGHWFWRGVQSAIFYYISCSPCKDASYKSQRRQEARLARKEVVTQQPGLIRQPRAFETNEEWTEEVLLGPGPPKGWEPHAFVRDARKKFKRPVKGPAPADNERPEQEAPSSRPSFHERRISTALENVKDTLRSSLHPEKWNWKRYDREDEFLGGMQTTMTRMWDKVAATVGYGEDSSPIQALKKVQTKDSERVDYSRGNIPAVNDLHPPVVSRLPATSQEVAWMIMPPPSAAVMAGKKPPGEETGPRKPLCIIGRPHRRRGIGTTGPVVDESTIETSSIEVWDAESIAASESSASSPPPRIETRKRAPHMFDALSDTEMFKLPPRPTPVPRPHSWTITYVIPSPPTPVHIR